MCTYGAHKFVFVTETVRTHKTWRGSFFVSLHHHNIHNKILDMCISCYILYLSPTQYVTTKPKIVFHLRGYTYTYIELVQVDELNMQGDVQYICTPYFVFGIDKELNFKVRWIYYARRWRKSSIFLFLLDFFVFEWPSNWKWSCSISHKNTFNFYVLGWIFFPRHFHLNVRCYMGVCVFFCNGVHNSLGIIIILKWCRSLMCYVRSVCVFVYRESVYFSIKWIYLSICSVYNFHAGKCFFKRGDIRTYSRFWPQN